MERHPTRTEQADRATADPGTEGDERALADRNGDAAVIPVPSSTDNLPTLREVAARLEGLTFPDEDFADDLEAIQAAQPLLGPSPWDS
jgi:hypothetical protein